MRLLMLCATVLFITVFPVRADDERSSRSSANPAEKEPKAGAVRPRPDPRLLTVLASRLRDKEEPNPTIVYTKLAKLLDEHPGSEADFLVVAERLLTRAVQSVTTTRTENRVPVDLLLRIGQPLVPFLKLRLPGADKHSRRVIVELLVRIGPVDSALISLLQPRLVDREWSVRSSTIQGLERAGPLAKNLVPDLVSVACDDPEIRCRVQARVALIGIAGPSEQRVRALSNFLEPLNYLDNPQGALKEKAIEAACTAAEELAKLGAPARIASPELLAALKHDEAQLRCAAAFALGQIGTNSPEVIEALIGALKNDPVLEVRHEAASALGAIGPSAKGAIVPLRAFLKDEWRVAARAIIKISRSDAVPVLIEGLSSADESIRHAAMNLLGNLGADAAAAVPFLEKAATAESQEQLRVAAKNAFDKIARATAKRKSESDRN